MDGLPAKPLAEGVCKFHVTDGVGTTVDERYGGTFVFDRLMRLIRRHSALRTGHLIFRAVANKFDVFVQGFKER